VIGSTIATMPKSPRKRASVESFDLEHHYKHQVASHLDRMPWVLRITERRDRPSPVLVVKYRRPIDESGEETRLVDRGVLYGDSLRRCTPTICQMLSRVRDEHDRNLDLHQYLQGQSIRFRGNLPLDEGTGARLALLFRLQERVKDLDRVELMARRIDNFSAEEATYWLSRTLHFSRASNRWALAGMRIMLGGLPGDTALTEMIARFSERS